MHSEKMTALERRAVFSISSIMGLRMIGLFMVLPVFSLYARQLDGATPALIGLAMGVYGLSQALFQIPFGTLSDHFGRKPVIVAGLLIFAAGSLIAGFAHSITLMIIGRALQGIGAVGSTMLALMADLTRENQRSKAMAIAGITIGCSFSIAMFLGPVLTRWIAVNHLFILACLFGCLGIVVLHTTVPMPARSVWHRDTEPELKSFLKLLANPELARLNSGILILHAIFTASFVVIPISLYQSLALESSRQWVLYLPTLSGSFLIALYCIGAAERKQRLKPFFLGGIAALAVSECLLWASAGSMTGTAIGLCLFFGGFSMLEAFLPSLVSRTAPASRKGSALGIYSCSQFLGIFIGGVLGGWLYGRFSFAGAYLFCTALALFWLLLACLMQPPRYMVNQIWRILPSRQHEWDALAARLMKIPGMAEVSFIADEGLAYLKMERAVLQHPEFISLKEQISP